MKSVVLFAAALLAAAAVVSANETHQITCTCFGYGYDSGNCVATSPSAQVAGSHSIAAGQTVTFQVSGSSLANHPVEFMSSPTNGATSTYPGVSSTAFLASAGTVTITIPATGYTTPLYVVCEQHAFYLRIDITAPGTAGSSSTGSPAPTPSSTGAAGSNVVNWAIAAPGFYYTVNGAATQNPTLTVSPGAQIVASLATTSEHPVCVQTTTATDDTANFFSGWLAPQTCASAGTITVNMPSTAGTNVYFICQIHGSAVMVTARTSAAFATLVSWSALLAAALTTLALTNRAF